LKLCSFLLMRGLAGIRRVLQKTAPITDSRPNPADTSVDNRQPVGGGGRLLDVGWTLVGAVVIVVGAVAAFIFAGIARKRRRRAQIASALDKALAALDPSRKI
jgi:hypothetical protein